MLCCFDTTHKLLHIPPATCSVTLHHFPWQGHLRLPSLVLLPAKLALMEVVDEVGWHSRLMKMTFDLCIPHPTAPIPSHERPLPQHTVNSLQQQLDHAPITPLICQQASSPSLFRQSGADRQTGKNVHL